MKKEMNEHQKAYVERFKALGWFEEFLYESGAVKVMELNHGVYKSSKPKFTYKFRFLHPVSFLLFFVYIAISGFNGNTKDDLKKGYTWW